MPKGSRPGERRGGRVKGTRNRKKASFRAELWAYCKSIGADPFKYMADMLVSTDMIDVGVDKEGNVIRRPRVDETLRQRAATELSQYLEPRLKALEHSGAGGDPLVIVHKYGAAAKRRDH